MEIVDFESHLASVTERFHRFIRIPLDNEGFRGRTFFDGPKGTFRLRLVWRRKCKDFHWKIVDFGGHWASGTEHFHRFIRFPLRNKGFRGRTLFGGPRRGRLS